MLNLCLCGAQDGYPHDTDCPRPLFRATTADAQRWRDDRDAIRTARLFDGRTSFGGLPHVERMEHRAAVEVMGAEVVGYDGPTVQVAIPTPAAPYLATVAARGFIEVPGSDHCFPLGSDSPPANLRHDGRYPGSAGFWRFVRFLPPLVSVR